VHISTLFPRLEERKLVPWALAYVAGAFVVLQLVDAVAEPLSLSVLTQRIILTLLVMGVNAAPPEAAGFCRGACALLSWLRVAVERAGRRNGLFSYANVTLFR
jgi:hypothetical protein